MNDMAKNGDSQILKSDVRMVPVSLLDVKLNYNPRFIFDEESMEELEEDIRVNGVLMPIMIQPKTDNRFFVVDGERRLRCIKRLNTKNVVIDRVKAIIVPAGLSEMELLQKSFSTSKGKTLTPLECGKLISKLIRDFGKTIQEVAVMLSLSIGTVNNRLTVWENAKPELIEQLKQGDVKFTEAVKKVRDGDSCIIDEEKQEKKEREKYVKSQVSTFLSWLWISFLDTVEEEEVERIQDSYTYIYDYLMEKYEKFKEKEQENAEDVEKEPAIQEKRKKRGRPSKSSEPSEPSESEPISENDENVKEEVKEHDDDEDILEEIENEEQEGQNIVDGEVEKEDGDKEEDDDVNLDDLEDIDFDIDEQDLKE